jgi:hypothetical protein
MSDDRRKILEMLSEGKITTDDAGKLLSALDKTSPSAGERAADQGGARSVSGPKYLRIFVDEQENGTHPPTKINIAVPLLLLRAGVKLGSLLPPQARANVDRALSEKGIPFNLSQMKVENVDELVDALSDMTIDIDAHGGRAKVKMYFE